MDRRLRAKTALDWAWTIAGGIVSGLTLSVAPGAASSLLVRWSTKPVDAVFDPGPTPTAVRRE